MVLRSDGQAKGFTMKKIIFFSLIFTTFCAMTAYSGDNEAGEASKMKIRIKVGDTVFTATMLNTETSRDFISLLPLTLRMKDYSGTEKISNLPRRLSTKNAPSGCDPSVGDITYYSPWGNLAIFYKDFGYSDGLIKLGSLDGGIEKLGSIKGDFEAVFQLIE
jgi:hypothetical protein